jgi:hypothetical protein
MVAGSAAEEQLRKKVAGIYEWLEARIAEGGHGGQCRGCGRCCDFESFDHSLFITRPELMYLAANITDENFRPMPTGRCPYNIEGKCTIYDYRFAGCRIFCCGGEADFQSELSEAVLGKLKTLCLEMQIPYCYSDLASALNGCADV